MDLTKRDKDIKELQNAEERIRKEMEIEIKQSSEKANEIVRSAEEEKSSLITLAKDEAKKIAGEALEIKDIASLYEKTVRAMKNQIKGYGDEYLIPNQTLLDDLADEYDHEKAGQELKEIKKKIKEMIKQNKAAECDYVEAHRKKTAIDFALDAFLGKVDTIMAKVKHDNYGKLKAMLDDALNLVNFNGSAFRNARITKDFFNLTVSQLDLAVKVQELKRKDQL